MRARLALVTFGGALIAAVFGGVITAAQAPARVAGPTFSKDVAPILYKNCVSCHRPGDIAPMSLLTYEDARPYGRAIRAKVGDGLMPPWHAEAQPGTFRNDRRLSDADKNTILTWVDNGMPEGNRADLPPAPVMTAGWSIGKPDVVLTMNTSFDVPASGEVPYKYFELPTNFTEDKWVQAIELRPGALTVVHHILAFARPPKPETARTPDFTPRIQASPAGPAAGGAQPAGAAAARGAAANRPVVAALQARGNANAGGGSAGGMRGALIATTAPGTNAMVFEPGQALLLKAGSIVSFQVHYTASGKATSDRSSIGFVFAKQPVKTEVKSSAFMNVLMTIPPGAPNHRVDAAIEFNNDSKILALFPHTHLRGKSWEYTMVYPDGRREVVLSVPRYDFNWQTYYEFTKPLIAPKGSRLEAVAHYDNSTGNKFNPNPNILVRWGEQTWEEMHYTGITYIVDEPGTTTGQQ
jgi:hypothetical protein